MTREARDKINRRANEMQEFSIKIGESESLRIGEVCDKPGKLRDDCIRTVCSEHASL
jgi:hypothetical protein